MLLVFKLLIVLIYVLGVHMLTLIVPVLVRFLDSAQLSNSAQGKFLTEISLQKLMKIGPKYPQVVI